MQQKHSVSLQKEEIWAKNLGEKKFKMELRMSWIVLRRFWMQQVKVIHLENQYRPMEKGVDVEIRMSINQSVEWITGEEEGLLKKRNRK